MSDDQRPKAKKDQRYRCSICHKAGQTIGYNAVHCHWDRIHKENGHPSSRKFRDKYIEVAAPGVIVEDGKVDENEAMEDTEEDEAVKETNSSTPTRRVKKKQKRGINELLNESNGNTTSNHINESETTHPPPHNHPPSLPSPWSREMIHSRRIVGHQQAFLPPQLHNMNHQQEHIDRHAMEHEERLRMANAMVASHAGHMGHHPNTNEEYHVKRENSGIKDLLNEEHHQLRHAHHHPHQMHHSHQHPLMDSHLDSILERMGQRLLRAEETILLLTHRCNALADANQHLGQLFTGVDANLSNLNGLVNEYIARGRSQEASQSSNHQPPIPTPSTSAAVTLAALHPPSPAKSNSEGSVVSARVD